MADISPFCSRSRLALASFQFADILIDNEAMPTAPASSKSILFVDSTSKKFAQLDDSGVAHGILASNFNTASQTTGAADTYITNSNILFPSFGVQVGSLIRWYISLFKATNAGTASIIWTLRLGTGLATTDTSVMAITNSTAQTAVTGGGLFVLTVQTTIVSGTGKVVFTVGESPMTASFGAPPVVTSLSAAFDNTTATNAGKSYGLSVNPGASTTFTIDSVRAELIG